LLTYYTPRSRSPKIFRQIDALHQFSNKVKLEARSPRTALSGNSAWVCHGNWIFFVPLGFKNLAPVRRPYLLSRAYSFFDMTRACSYWTGYPCRTQTSLSCGLRPGQQQVNINGNSVGWFEGKSIGNNKSPVDFLAGKNPIRNNREHELFLRWNHVKLGGWT
jgi:hypothetical protein